ncbi:MAG: hypothetical protein JWR26_2982 [Pedosphaera sp.]|nr:hypothetical protein [Pedosphaera sp.]
MRREISICLVLGLVTAALCWPVTHFGFINYDDPAYVTENFEVQGGVTGKSVAWAFITGHAANWHPLTWISHSLDCQIYGLNASGHHVTNLLFHLANTVLLFWVLRRMTGAVWRSAMVAALFGIHPAHVESVAWIAERKDVLSTLFWLLTIWAYVRYTEKPRIGRYLLSILFFVLGLLSKPMVVTLPFVLLLLDYWPLGRIVKPAGGKADSAKRSAKGPLPLPWSRLVLEKAPFFILAFVSCAVTFLVQRHGGAVSTFERVSPGLRMANAVVAYVRYVGEMVWPVNLCILYPLPSQWAAWAVGASILALVVITAGVLVAGRRGQPAMLIGWLWFLGTLVPVIGLVQVGSQSMADRYTYIPYMGLFVMVVWGVAALTRKWKQQKVVLGAAAGAVLLACGYCTAGQFQYWKSSEALFRHAISVTETNGLAHIYLGDALVSEKKFDDGVTELMEAAKIYPGYGELQGRIGVALASEGKIDEAMTRYRGALELNPDLPEALNNLAWILAANENAARRNGPEAVRLAERACDLTHYQTPRMIGTLAAAYAEAGRFKDATDAGEKAISAAVSSGNVGLAEVNRKLTEMYRAGRAYHE